MQDSVRTAPFVKYKHGMKKDDLGLYSPSTRFIHLKEIEKLDVDPSSWESSKKGWKTGKFGIPHLAELEELVLDHEFLHSECNETVAMQMLFLNDVLTTFQFGKWIYSKEFEEMETEIIEERITEILSIDNDFIVFSYGNIATMEIYALLKTNKLREHKEEMENKSKKKELKPWEMRELELESRIFEIDDECEGEGTSLALSLVSLALNPKISYPDVPEEGYDRKIIPDYRLHKSTEYLINNSCFSNQVEKENYDSFVLNIFSSLNLPCSGYGSQFQGIEKIKDRKGDKIGSDERKNIEKRLNLLRDSNRIEGPLGFILYPKDLPPLQLTNLTNSIIEEKYASLIQDNFVVHRLKKQFREKILNPKKEIECLGRKFYSCFENCENCYYFSFYDGSVQLYKKIEEKCDLTDLRKRAFSWNSSILWTKDLEEEYRSFQDGI